MNSLKKVAIRSDSWHKFLSEVLRWLHWHNRKFPELKTWTKQELHEFYDGVKEEQRGLSKAS